LDYTAKISDVNRGRRREFKRGLAPPLSFIKNTPSPYQGEGVRG
jgi:hypothetical protein